MFKRVIFSLLVLMVSLSAEEVLELNINNEDIEFRVAHELQMGQTDDSRFYMGAFFMNSNDKNKGYANLDDDKLYGAEFFLKNRVMNDHFGLHAKLGIKAIAHSHTNDDFLAVPLGGGLDLKMQFENFPPVTIGAEYYYAPKVLTFMDSTEYTEFRLQWKVEIVKNGELMIGYRGIGTDYSNFDLTYNSSLYAGIILHID